MTADLSAASGRGVVLARDLSHTELALVRLLQVDGRATYSALGRELGVAPKTAGRLAQGLIDRRVVEITAVTVPAVFGYRALASVILRSDGRRARYEAAQTIFGHGAVDYVAVMSGPADLMANVVCRDLAHLNQVVGELLEAETSVALVEVAPYLSLPLQRPSRSGVLRADERSDRETVTLEEVDQRILDRLVRDGREPYLQIAGALEVSESYVRQRVQRLTDSGAVQIRAIVDPRSLGYDVQAWISIEHASGDVEGLVGRLAELPAISFLAETAGSFDMFAEVLCGDMAELRQAVNAMRAIPGIRKVTPHLYFDLFYRPMHFH